MTPFEIRPVDPDGPHVRPFVELARLAFKDNTPITDAAIAVRRRSYAEAYLTGAFDGDLLVGTFRSWPTSLSVPGEPGRTVPATAVSTVAVLPTHTRRGILTAQMRHHLDRAAAQGSSVAVLIASEAVIYGRYGFAPATEKTALELDLGRARLRAGVPDPGGVSFAGPEEFRELAPAIFDASRPPGEIDRPWWWWDFVLDPDNPKAGDKRPVRLVHRRDDGTPDGYLTYTYSDVWEHFVSRSVIHLGELVGADATVRIALWRYLLSVDAVATLTADPRPIDEPLRALLEDVRAVHRTERSDMLWARLLNLSAFFDARGYEPGVAGRCVLRVRDELGFTDGLHELQVDGAGTGRCRPVDGVPPDVDLAVGVLSSACLGAGDLIADHEAGRVVEHRPGAVARLAALLRTTRPPFTGTWF